MFFAARPFAEADGGSCGGAGQVGFRGGVRLPLPRPPHPQRPHPHSRPRSHPTGLAAAVHCSSFNCNQLPAAFAMAAYESRQDELAQFQELSNKWEPEATVGLPCEAPSPPVLLIGHQGPLVSERQSSNAITAEYADADPIFQAKTAVRALGERPASQSLTVCQALPQKYVQMRTCRGDGLCGWRGTNDGTSSWC